MCDEKNLRGLRADLKLYDDFMINQEEFNKIIEAFANMPKKYIAPHNALLYVSSVWKEGENDGKRK